LKSRIIVLMIIIILLSSTNTTVGNPGGNGDDNRDFTCGGSCHGDPSLSQPSDGIISIQVDDNIFAGTAVAVHVTASDMSLSNNRILGVFLLSSLNGNGDQPNDHGWRIIQDPNGGTKNYVETIVPTSGTVTLTWVLTAPEQIGAQNLYAEINHGQISNSDNTAFTGVSDVEIIQVQSVPDNLPGFSNLWTAPDYRISGEFSPLVINTENTDSITVKWKLEGEWQTHDAEIILIEQNIWQVHLPSTMEDTRIQYIVTTSNGDFSINQPWLTIGTNPPDFEGTLLGARLQALAFTTIIMGFLITLQTIMFKSDKKENHSPVPSNNSQSFTFDSEVGSNKNTLIPHPDYPGWLWDSVDEKWVSDPDNLPLMEVTN